MTLALRLGWSLAEVMERIDTYELSLWREYDRVSPIGDERADVLAALMSATVAQAAGAKVAPADMLMRWGGIGEAQAEAEEQAGESAFKTFLLSKISRPGGE